MDNSIQHTFDRLLQDSLEPFATLCDKQLESLEESQRAILDRIETLRQTLNDQTLKFGTVLPDLVPYLNSLSNLESRLKLVQSSIATVQTRVEMISNRVVKLKSGSIA